MLFTNEFIASLRSQPLIGCMQVCKVAFDRVSQQAVQGWQDRDYEVLSEAYAVVSTVLDSGLLKIRIEAPSLRGRIKEDCTAINQYLNRLVKECTQIKSQERIEQIKANVRQSLGVVTQPEPDGHYQLDAQDLQRMEELISQLQSALNACSVLTEPHKARLRARIERMRRELRPQVPDLDRVWGLIGDARVLIEKIGAQARPMVSRLTELGELTWRIQSRTEGLHGGQQLSLGQLLQITHEH